MILSLFGKIVKIDAENKGVQFYLNNMSRSVTETIMMYWYMLKEDIADGNIAIQQLSYKTESQLRDCVLLYIKDELLRYSISKEYANYIEV